ncbi:MULTISPECIES: carbon-nitrogen hydrolase [unclassified Campylobacter]|uniref:carbon-nitrogen hydrolase n=1 Tax=unclassified Campylobacter TaxID=2593542 RepID=UPI0022E9A060|nr:MULTISPECIES: carbon-nitrogen hydrolase [unclassified Campylobacter]MDA3042667.1 carbon-nitrogen hydrolase [Campylobacter sp. JMF_09 ED2]MDA3044519.1 carbon-nitrogen hydrolase [Campylobacter sp. JMF_07 ED4]MDA3063358.1 carbon-nitrogen hydrolase [Campylobacter sp. JMF_11 EL3]MDA3071496.1 carbon-nitrogen hydrolase [Campylobacter sp. VBCF_03 NA9]MDA3074440.1 carbon-nitrogen hydrolase [Campylobacter sp. JMF_05 ED3]
MKNLKVGLISHKFYGTKSATIARTKELIAKAAQKGANLIVLQELHQTHYFCQRENTENFDYATNFEDDVKFWGSIAKEFGVVLVASLFERRSAGLYHNTAVVFERDGKVLGKYRKMHIPDDPNFYEKFYFTPGDMGFEPIDTSVGRLGVLVCWDQWYPEAARAMALRGAQVLIYPTAIGWFMGDESSERERQLEAWVAVQRGHSVANSLPVIAVNRVGFESAKLSEISPNVVLGNTAPEMTCDESAEGIKFWGNSFVFGAQGEELFRADSESELCEVVEIDMQRCENVRRWWPFLRDRRIESYGSLLKRFDD